MAPWRGRSALDAVELMNMAWDKRREHLRPEQRSHYVITDGGDQPNVVPSVASVWYYFREQTFDAIDKNLQIGNKMADAAATMTDTTVKRRILGAAAPQHFNKPIAEAANKNIQAVGLPQWTADEQAFAKAVQKNLDTKEEGLAIKLDGLTPPEPEPRSGGSDDIGDVSWTVPTIVIRYPSNIPGLPGHHWSNAIAMATPIAHKGVVSGAKVVAMTTLDLLVDAKLPQQRPRLLHQRADQGSEVRAGARRRGSSQGRVQRGHDGPLSGADQEVLLRREPLRDVSGSARREVPDADASPERSRRGERRSREACIANSLRV